MTIKAHFDGKVLVPDEPINLPKDQRVVLDLREDSNDERPPITAGELANSELVGVWADRDDIGDSTEWVNEIRRRIERREI